ncbi:MAG TPA: O-antigen ligase family protein [Burkholderiales bacterium]|nr:O-antigen ligase family protein [Burkholderiales bacterium]
MAVGTARLGAERTPGLALGVVGLGIFGVLCGIGLAVGEYEALIISLSLLAAVAVLADFRVGAVLLLIMMPVEGSYLFPHNMLGVTGLNPFNVVLGATLLAFLVRGRDLKRFVPKPLFWLYLVPVVIAGFLGTRHVDDIYPYFYEVEVIHFTDAMGYLRDVLVKPMFMVVASLLIGQAVAQAKRVENFLVPIIIAVWVMSLMLIGFVVTSGLSLGQLALATQRTLLSVLGMHANDLGRLYAVAYGLLLFTWGETKDVRLKTVLVVTMGALTLALLFTFSRGAFIGWALVNVLFLVWKFNARTAAIAIFCAGVGLAVMPGAVVSRMTLGLVGGTDVNEVSAGRIDEIWLPLMPELFKSPVWGSGLDSTMWANALWAETMLPVTHPHNAYLQAILDMGLLGLGLLLAFYWTVYRKMRALGSNAYLSPTMRGFYQGAVAGLMCFIVTGFAGSSLRATPEFAFLWIAIGMMYGQLLRKPEAGPAWRAQP